LIGWPLLPTCQGTLCALTATPGQGSKVVDGSEELRDELKAVLSRLGVRILDPQYMSASTRAGLAGVVQRPTLRGVLRALGVANGGSFEHLCQRISVLSLLALLVQKCKY